MRCPSLILAPLIGLVLSASFSGGQELTPTAKKLLKERETLAKTIWAPEQVAQNYEASITRLWDNLRAVRSGSAAAVFREIQCDRWTLPNEASRTQLALGIEKRTFDASNSRILNRKQFAAWVKDFESNGFRLLECEFHHSAFQQATEKKAAESQIDFLLNLENRAQTGGQRLTVTGQARVVWAEAPDQSQIKAQEIEVRQLSVLRAALQAGFVRAATFERRENEFQSAHPVLLRDLDQDGDAEIIIPRWNRRYDNQLTNAKPQLVDSAFLTHWKAQEECGLLADINGDGQVDYVTVVKQQGLTVYLGAKGGTFPDPGQVIFQDDQLLAPMALTAGDIDGDHDLDLFLTQYKPSYVKGQMPTPFYDANDGFPSYLLQNDAGKFSDVTAQSGLGSKRFRRTYSATLVDLDADRDLDLTVVSDYAGIDVYENDGGGKFSDISDKFRPNRLFGMGQSIADFDADGRLDLLAIGMSSSTARRLDSLGLGREDRKDYRTFRAAMGYGNRMYLRKGNGFVQSLTNSQVARTGWSWGSSAFDFDNDGTRDVYIANGFRSGKSSRDYCSNYWCQDLYAGGSHENPALVPVFARSMQQLNKGLISWNGYEHNHLKLNLGGGNFENIAFLFGVSFEYDSRIALTEDFDHDGRVDLLVSEYTFLGRGFQSKLHLYLNRLKPAKNPNHWVEFVLQSSPGRSVLGATVTLETAKGTQVHPISAGDAFLSQDAPTAHFGLGQETQIQEVKVQWPGGGTTVVPTPQSDRIHLIK